jgi:hypothetical protein
MPFGQRQPNLSASQKQKSRRLNADGFLFDDSTKPAMTRVRRWLAGFGVNVAGWLNRGTARKRRTSHSPAS